jgi:hypothetical protein
MPKCELRGNIVEDTTLPPLDEETRQERKTNIKSLLKDVKLEAATKIVRSNLREWGKTSSSSASSLVRKFKMH